MGANASAYEEDDETITVMKGVRLTENVINRMRGASASANTQSPPTIPENNPFGVFLLCDVASEEGLCRTVTQEQELQKGREQHMSLTELEVHQGVEQEKVQAQMQVEERFAEENLKQSILADRAAAQDHRLRAHLYAHQLEQRIRELKKQDALYREQVAKLEWRGKRFYSAITESYQKASREVSAKFRQNQINPVCADLQREILKCYRENTGHTLSCSKIASLYLQCVTEARQSKTRPGD
ncbi:hypothetical protein ANANG_G00237100 [Anguilla anguilla]|uniref:CHCH domain-containing protein n=1 Tax=Anguilla anguilla TaxID=7936 RepID=A0A9D3LUG8_ANGAN|nr:hypothetical protein ANANG_G00237100 [Anguilla anguilla]